MHPPRAGFAQGQGVSPLELLVPRTRSSRTPSGKSDRELRVQRGTRIIELLVVLGFRSSHENVPRNDANFGIGPLVGTGAVSAVTKCSLGNPIRGGISLDGRHFGLIATNFEHHGSNSSPVGIIRGARHDVAGHLCGGTCGVGRCVRNRCAHSAQSEPPA